VESPSYGDTDYLGIYLEPCQNSTNPNDLIEDEPTFEEQILENAVENFDEEEEVNLTEDV